MTLDSDSDGQISALSRPVPEPPYLSVVVPAYNEAARIETSLRRLRQYLNAQPYRSELIVVDDGSQDDTARRVQHAAAAGSDGLRLLRYRVNRGKGYAVRHGMMQAAGRYVLFSDADLATPIEELETLLSALRQQPNADIAIGSRDAPGSRLLKRQSIVRETGGKLFNRCVQLLAVPGIRDTQCGFKLFSRRAARDVCALCRIDNFSFDVEMLFLARRLGYTIVEVPVRWAHQEGSKVRFVRDGWRMLTTLWRIRSTDYGLPTTPPTPARHEEAAQGPGGKLAL
jgi:dolichyl-phosphate beta-glucosyltransferase